MPAELIVIDGPAGAGKSTVARRIADLFGAALLDTGAIYRSLAWLARGRGVAWEDEAGLAAIAAELRIEFQPPAEPGTRQRVLILSPLEAPERGPIDVTGLIRSPEISEGASRVSQHAAVRGALLDIQRAIAATSVAAGRGCVAEGRDMGTVVFPDAAHKFFLTATRDARASRRHKELTASGELAASGEAPSRSEVETEMARRDQRDSSRETAPLQQAKDAALIDSSELDIDAVVARIVAAVRGPGQTTA
ncbi:Cytidylate kinase [Enhygromyxa salina]|uniref:Cytidylate kinase n=1 Tax=Enhygromyxa salina TaxID=215803 RepID=A0A0C2CPR1_9BACT|nr:(d)CMP kinase [Enhygromyxa salina]KIG13176.1 Cytidylate kinase [Enhygromyxa salina]